MMKHFIVVGLCFFGLIGRSVCLDNDQTEPDSENTFIFESVAGHRWFIDAMTGNLFVKKGSHGNELKLSGVWMRELAMANDMAYRIQIGNLGHYNYVWTIEFIIEEKEKEWVFDGFGLGQMGETLATFYSHKEATRFADAFGEYMETLVPVENQRQYGYPSHPFSRKVISPGV